MSNNIFAKKKEIADLVNNLVLQRDVFQCDAELNMWRSTYVSIYGISNLLEIQLKRGYWKNTPYEKPIKQLRRNTARFIRLIHRKGTTHGEWMGACQECAELIHEYQRICLPQIEYITKELDECNPIRMEIEDQLKTLNSALKYHQFS